ncbi:uncharacterized protein FFFS_03796 [Fusarium fujikuroi]|nr:uncharacterized protein FFFS_03796 [Fusarium fujikuroi]
MLASSSSKLYISLLPSP